MPPTTDSAGQRRKTHGALATASRVRILELVRGSSTPLDVQQIAARSGLHPNTVRFHLRVLIDAGLAHRRPDPRGGSGRPRLVYSAVTAGSVHRHANGYLLLADILAGFLAADSTVRTGLAEEAGREFARRQRLPAQRSPDTADSESVGTSTGDAVHRAVAMFTELGFEPELRQDGSHRRILLHACPFHAVARKHPGVVCALHLGLIKQTLADLDAPSDTIRLEPFVTPRLCIAHLTEPPG